MPEGKIALRQLLCLLFAALLSPTVRVLPGRTAAAAGAARDRDRAAVTDRAQIFLVCFMMHFSFEMLFGGAFPVLVTAS